MKFVVIGGDAAGMSAASKVKRNDPTIEVTVLEKTLDVSYSACGMPYNIADSARNMDDLIVRKAEVFREKNNINLLTGHRVDKIDPVTKTVSGVILYKQNHDSFVSDSSISKVPSSSNNNDADSNNDKFSYPFDKLLIATGAAPILPNIEGINLKGVMPLKNLEHGRDIKNFITSNNVKNAVIIGMGYIALEMCEALKARSIEVAVVKPRSGFLPWMTPQLSDVVKQELLDNGIKIFNGYNIEKIELSSNSDITAAKSGICGSSCEKITHPLSVICSNNLTLNADMVIAAAGVRPCSELAVNAGLQTSVSGSISVDRTLKTSDYNIYAAGDCADAYHVVSGQKCWIPLALRANRAGWAAADNICGGLKIFLQGVAGTAVFKMFDLQIARTGLSLQEALNAGFDPAEAVVQTRSKAHGHPGSNPIYVSMVGDKKTGKLLGVQMVGKDGAAHRINAAAVALHAKMSVQDFFQTDLAYAPPYGPVWDPLLTAANQLLKQLSL